MSGSRATFGLTQASRRWWVTLFVLFGASASVYAGRNRMAPSSAEFGGPAQGTTYSVVLGHGGARTAADTRALQFSVDSVIADIDRKMSSYVPESELMRFNRNTSTAPVSVSAQLEEVLRQSLAVSEASSGAFDVTVGPLVNAWGFGSGGTTDRIPSDTLLSALRARVGWKKLHLNGHAVSKDHPALDVDLSAIAPGYTVDLISELLTARGEPNHFVELGGEVRARGRNARNEPFRVGIEEPIPDVRRVRSVVGLSNRSMATSGNYRDFQDLGGVRYSHILDPSTGVPVRHNLLSVSVLHKSCAVADAWATALFVVGAERAWDLAAANSLDVLLLTAGPNGEVQERMTNGFRSIVLTGDELRPVDHSTRRSDVSKPGVP